MAPETPRRNFYVGGQPLVRTASRCHNLGDFRVAGSGDLGGTAGSRLVAVGSTSKVSTWRLLPEENSVALMAATTCPRPAPNPKLFLFWP
jgi:hypothetical protein